MAKHTVCEHGMDTGKGKRCRKHATLAVGYRILFGHRVGPHGETPEYMLRVTFRCPAHERTDIPGEFVQSMPRVEYMAALAAKRE